MKNYLISKNIPESKVFVTGIPISSRFLQKYDKKEILDEFNLQDNKYKQFQSEEYYINMMIAWYFATALAKQYDSALP